MPISATAFVRSTVTLLLVGVLALAVIVGTTIWLVERTQVLFDEVIVARDVRAVAVDLRNAIQQAESGQRGYLLTQDAAYLQPYEQAAPTIPALVQNFNDKASVYPEAAQRLPALRDTLTYKLDELQRTVDLAKAGQIDQAIALVRGGTGNAAMDEARTLFAEIIALADGRLVAGVTDQRGASDALRLVTVIGALMIVIVIGSSVWVALSYTRDLSAARQALDVANLGLEERVRERTQDLGRANEEIQRFAYIVTHDLRAPLVNIMGFTSELETSIATLETYMSQRQDDGAPDFAAARAAATEDLPEAITFIRAATRKMDGLINAILKISREGRRQLKPEQIDLGELVEASSNAIHHQVTEGGGKITADIQVPRIVSDRLSLEQVLGNLFDNAVKYQQPDRPLVLDIRARQASGNRIEIIVADNGRGIAETDHERVFELFRRSGAQSKPGEGIGLAHVRTMVRSLGGDITLASELGRGSTFTITLPRDLRGRLGRQTA